MSSQCVDDIMLLFYFDAMCTLYQKSFHNDMEI